MCAAPSQGRGRRTPESRNNNVNDILSGAKRNFLSATEKLDGAGAKTPVKREQEPEVAPSPKSLLKHPSISLGTPEKNKQPKFWKTRWQEKVNGRLSEGRGKKRRGNEADKLLGDEGVIQMLNKVPSVFGEMPRSASNTSSRVQRVRAAASKPANTASTVASKPGRAASKRHGSTDSKKSKLDSKTVKQEPVETSEPSSSNSGGFVSPKRTVRNISRDFSTQEVVGSMVNDDDSFTHLTELPSEQLESLMNCDIRYSLPKQGAPVQNKPSKQSKKEDLKESSQSQMSSPETTRSSSSDRSSAALVKVNSVSKQSSFSKQASLKLPPVPVNSIKQNSLKDVIQFEFSDQGASSDSLGPGQFSHIHLRLWDSWAQISLTSAKTRLRGSLNPDIIEEITHALGYVSSVAKYRGVLVTGVGNVFCQGVDLHYLCSDHQERRKGQAALMAAAVERLVITLSTFPKLLVAAVNGDASGLGFTLLPLFDLVYANDKATFKTYYSRLGQIPEGGASATLPQFTSGLGGALPDMLLMGRVLTASELLAAGLVTATFFPGRLMEEVVPRMKRACSQQNLGLQWNKLLLKQHQKSQVEQVMGGETELLTEIWSSKQFHVSLVNFINTEKCLQFQKPL